MDNLRTFGEFNRRDLEIQLIKFLHEGVRMVKVDSINESSMMDHVDFELDYISKKAKKAGDSLIITEYIPEIKALAKKFSDSGQSGGSAPFTSGAIVDTIKKLLSYEPLGGVQNEESEWNDMGGDTKESKRMFQNNRLSSVFKDGKKGKPYFIDSIIFKGQNGSTFTGNSIEMPDGSTIGSANFIKKFPFEPKSFVIDVVETEWADKEEKVKQEGGGWWTSVVKNPSQLDEVWEYYNKMER